MRINPPPGLYYLLLILFFFTALLPGCGWRSQSLERESPLDPLEDIRRLEKEFALARQNDYPVLSPDMFAKAEAAFLKAKTGMEAGSPIPDIQDHLQSARLLLKTADDNVTLAKKVLAEVVESRRMARMAGAIKILKDYEYAEEKFLDLTRGVEYNNIRYSKRYAPEVNDLFRKLEMRAIKTETIGAVRDMLGQAEKEGLPLLAPESFAQARKMLAETDAFISANPYAKEEMMKKAGENLFMVRRAVSIADQCRGIRNLSPEEIALYVEETLQAFSDQLGAPDMRDQKFYIQVDNVKQSIQTMAENNRFLAENIETLRNNCRDMKTNNERKIDDLYARIGYLEGKTPVEQAKNEKLRLWQRADDEKSAREQQLNRLYEEIRKDFNAEEAAIYKKGDQVVIRLTGLRFSEGQSAILPEDYRILGKVQRAVQKFGNPSVVVEGHTDCTGTRELNKHLSRERAEMVRKYLVSSPFLPPEKVIALGFGPERPLGADTPPVGNATNRRIDIIITPDTDILF